MIKARQTDSGRHQVEFLKLKNRIPEMKELHGSQKRKISAIEDGSEDYIYIKCSTERQRDEKYEREHGL